MKYNDLKYKFFYLAVIFTIYSYPLYQTEAKYVIVISLDGFRWDYLNRSITPNIDSIAQNGVRALSLKPVFPTASCPNLYSVLTGLYPENHGIIANNFFDFSSGETFSIDDEDARTEPKWFYGRALWGAFKKYGILSASCLWPGSDIDDEARAPEYNIPMDGDASNEEIIFKALEWLALKDKRPRFITLRLGGIDEKGHLFGTNSAELNNEIIDTDILIGRFYKKICEMGLKDSLNLIILSPHGMTDIDTNYIDLFSSIDCADCKIQNYGVYMAIEPQCPEERKKIEAEKIYKSLKISENHFTVYKKENIPAYYHFSANPNISSIIIVPEESYVFINKENQNYKELKAAHGYGANLINMHGIFVAAGPDFKNGFNTGTLETIDIYSMLCALCDIPIPTDIDGKFDRIKYILNKE